MTDPRDPRLPMDAPEQREKKQGDYCLDLSIERGPNMSIRMEKIRAQAAYAAIRRAHDQGVIEMVEIEHDCGSTLIDAGLVLVATIRPYEDPVEQMMSHEGAAVIGMIGRRSRPN